MAKIVLTDATITINAVELSDLSNSVTINYEVDSIEVTAFGDTGHNFTGGLRNLSVEIALMQDYAAGKTEATIYPLVGTTTTLAITPVSGGIGLTNPLYTITGAFLASHTPVAGAVGELSMTTLTFTGGTIAKSTGA
jgi:hypothetical protein